MSPSLDSAINVLQAEVDAFKQGTADQPKEETPEWFRLRALAMGLALLKSMRQCESVTPSAAERMYRDTSKALKIAVLTSIDASA